MAKTQGKTPIDIQVRIDRLMVGEDSAKAFASVTIGGAFAVHDIRITEKDNKVTVGMPFRSYKSGGETKYVDTFHPITAEARSALVAEVTKAYEAALEQELAGPKQSKVSMHQHM